MKNDLGIVGSSIRATARIGIGLIGPTGKVLRRILIVVRATPQWNERLLRHKDLLDPVNSIQLSRLIGRRSVSVEQFIGRGIVPCYEIELIGTDSSTI